MADIAFALQSYKDASLPVSAQSCVNAHAELEPPDAKTPVKVTGVPGIDTFATCGAGPVRGFYEYNSVVYTISGNTFYSVPSSGVATIVGAGISGNAPVSVDANSVGQICIVNGVSGYIYDINTNAFAQIVDPDFNPANTVTLIDDYFAFDHVGTNQFFLSDLLDGTSYDPLLFASAESNPDQVFGVHNAYSNLAIAGGKTIEVWQDTGAINFPFQRINGATVEQGVASPLAWAEVDNGHFFLGNDLVFYRLVGTQPQRLSTHAIEQEWASYSTMADAFCFVVSYGGHKIIYVTAPTGGSTYGYDLATQLWHQRSSWNPNGIVGRWRANCSILAYGSSKMLIGDANSGKIGVLNPATYTEFGDPIILDMIGPHIDGKGSKVFVPEFQLDMEGGVGTASGQGSNPQVMFRYSLDGGRTWSSENWMPLGDLGQFLIRLRWTRLGSGFQFTPRITISDPVKRVVIRARAPGLYFGAKAGT